MFDINTYFENFKDRNGYKELSKTLKSVSELCHDGTYVELDNFKIPSYNHKPELEKFSNELEKKNWNSFDIDMFNFGLKLYTSKELENDIEAFSLCMLCKDLFPEKTELFELIIQDLEKGTDNRSEYVELFDLQSDIVNCILFYMS